MNAETETKTQSSRARRGIPSFVNFLRYLRKKELVSIAFSIRLKYILLTVSDILPRSHNDEPFVKILDLLKLKIKDLAKKEAAFSFMSIHLWSGAERDFIERLQISLIVSVIIGEAARANGDDAPQLRWQENLDFLAWLENPGGLFEQ